MGSLIWVLPCLLLGYLGGLLTFQRKQRWCGGCGAMLTCPKTGCEARQLSSQAPIDRERA